MSVGILCDRVWKGYYVTNRKGGTKLHEEKSIQGSIALHIANLCRILIFRNVLWISDAEHGISMLDKYQNVGWKKFYLIYGMCDETFSVNCTTEVPEGVDKRMVYVFCDAFEPDLLGGRCNRRGTAWHNGDTVSAVFNFPGRKRTTGIYPISG